MLSCRIFFLRKTCRFFLHFKKKKKEARTIKYIKKFEKKNFLFIFFFPSMDSDRMEKNFPENQGEK